MIFQITISYLGWGNIQVGGNVIQVLPVGNLLSVREELKFPITENGIEVGGRDLTLFQNWTEVNIQSVEINKKFYFNLADVKDKCKVKYEEKFNAV